MGLTLRLLGGIEAQRDGEPISGLHGTKTGLLLAYLATEQAQRHPRVELAARFWPELARATARANLRQSLFQIRDRLGLADVVTGDRTHVWFEPGEHAWLDCAALDDSARCQQADTPAHGAALATAIGHYRGPFVEHQPMDALSEGLRRWVTDRRAEFRQRAGALVEQLCSGLIARGRAADAVEAASEFLERDPANETAHRLLMRLLAEQGGTTAALDQYRKLRALLARECNALPEEATEALRDRIEATAVSTSNAAALRVERRVVSVLACRFDIPTGVGAERGTEIMGRERAAAVDLLVAHRGHVVLAHGAALLAYFGYPAPREQATRRAVGAALALTARTGEGGITGKEGTGEPRIAPRIGLDGGWMLTGADPDLPDPMGDRSSRADRLAAAAEPGAVLVSREVAEAVAGLFELVPAPLGVNAGANVSAEPAYKLRPARGGHQRLAARLPGTRFPLVGRTREFEHLRQAWIGARAGNGCAITIVGPAGVGKSRLVAGLCAEAQARGARIVALHGSPDGGSNVLRPVAELFGQLLGGANRDRSPETRRARLRALLAVAGQQAVADESLLSHALGLAPSVKPPAGLDAWQIRDRTLAALLRLVTAVAGRRPMVLVFEDVQWLDPTSLELLGRVAASADGRPLLLLATTRLDSDVSRSAPEGQRVELDGLDAARSRELIDTRDPSAALSADVRQAIVETSGGIPLFLETLVRHCESVADPALALAESMPSTLHELLIARLEVLGEARTVLEVAAAIGPAFQQRELAEIAEAGASDLDAVLTRAVSSGFIEPDPLHTGRYRFCHDLVRRAAHETMSSTRRARVHGRIADRLIAADADRAAPGDIAQHLEIAGQPVRAVPYRLLAGHHSLASAAHQEALGHFGQALASAEDGKPGAVEARIGLGMAEIAACGYGSAEAEAAFRAARAASDPAHDPDRYFRVLWGLWGCASSYHGFEEAGRLAAEMLALADRRDDRRLRVAAHAAQTVNRVFSGDIVGAIDHWRQVRAHHDAADHGPLTAIFGEDPGLTARAMGAWALWLAGDTTAASDELDAAVAAADAAGHALSRAFVRGIAAFLAQRRGDVAAAAATAESVLAITGPDRYPLWAAVATMVAGWARVRAGEPEGAGEIEAVVAAIDRVMEGSATPFRMVLADARIHLGDFSGALATAETGMAAIERTGDAGMLPDLWLQCAQVHGARGESVAAAAAIDTAAALAADQGAALTELRAAALRCRLPGAGDDARERLDALLTRWPHPPDISELRA